MGTFADAMKTYQEQLKVGDIQVAYRGLMDYILALRNHFQAGYPHYSVPGSIYFGYMDMTYFSIVPAALKLRKLKIAIVFLHEPGRFEAWLAAVNKPVQEQYWRMIKDSGWDRYPLVPTNRGADAILEHVLLDRPDFSDLATLTAQLERSTLDFITNVEGFLSRH